MNMKILFNENEVKDYLFSFTERTTANMSYGLTIEWGQPVINSNGSLTNPCSQADSGKHVLPNFDVLMLLACLVCF